MCEIFMRCKEVLKNKPVLKTIQRKIIEENVPGIKLDYIIRNKSANEDGDNDDQLIYLYNQSSFPLKRFPQSRFKILNQITHIDASDTMQDISLRNRYV